MKKLFYSLFILATTAMTFCSCEDVPSPFDFPTKGSETPGATIDPAGSGTQADPYNVAAAINFTQQLEMGEESSNDVYIKGKVVSIRENYTTQYGNASFTISDDGTNKGTFLVYRALYLGNKKYTSGDLLQEGDEVIVCGKVTNYNGTLETQQNKAFLYSLNGKSEGGGGGTGGEAKGSGTLEDPYNPAGAAAAVKNLTWTSNDVYDTTGDVYVKGKISRIADKGTFTEGGTYGNASFYISEDGKESGEFYCFRVLYLGNKKFEAGNTDIKVGDEVIIFGKLMNYRGNTPETVASKAYVYSLNGKTEGGGGGGDTPTSGGTLTNPWTPEQANAYTSGLSADVESSQNFYIKGKIAKIANNGTFNTQYGNASFYISADGQDNNTFYVFRTLYLGNRKWVDGDTQIKVGDEVVICGKVVNYRGNTPETVQNESYIYSLNGKTDGGGDTPGGSGDDGSNGSYSNPFTVPGAIAAFSAGNVTGVYVKAYIVGSVDGQVYASGAVFGTDGTQKTNILIAASASETDPEKCMPVQLPNTDIRAQLNLTDNPGNYKKEVLLYGNIEKYFGVPGVKSVTYAEIGGKTIGTKASAKRKARRR